jgi:hypothetical protein
MAKTIQLAGICMFMSLAKRLKLDDSIGGMTTVCPLRHSRQRWLYKAHTTTTIGGESIGGMMTVCPLRHSRQQWDDDCMPSETL